MYTFRVYSFELASTRAHILEPLRCKKNSMLSQHSTQKSLISYFFLHLSFGHILWNMLFLYWFGKIIHDNIGNNAVISLYILGGIIGGLSYMALFNIIPFYGDRVSESLMLGASAGVFSVVAGSATLLPNYTFYLLFLGPVRIKYIALFYILLSFFDVTLAS